MNEVVGFNNTGVICWFNALLQGLLSCKYFVHTIMTREGNQNPIVLELQKLIKSIDRCENSSKVYDSVGVLRALLTVLRHKEKQRYREFAGGQQSASEGFTLLLDYIDSAELNQFFTHKYEEQILCIETGKNEPDTTNHGFNNQFMVFDEESLMRDGLDSFIKYHEHLLTDYKGTDPRGTYKRVYGLKYLPKIVVILLNRYHRRNPNISLPPSFDMPSCLINGSMRYKKVAEVDHAGSLGGGHYLAKVLRNDKAYLCNDSTFVDYRLGTSPNTYMTFYEYSENVLHN